MRNVILAALAVAALIGFAADANAGQRRIIVRAPCVNCAIDLPARFVGCVIRNGQVIWQYATARGVMNMTIPRRGKADMIRFMPDGRLAWVRG